MIKIRKKIESAIEVLNTKNANSLVRLDVPIVMLKDVIKDLDDTPSKIELATWDEGGTGAGVAVFVNGVRVGNNFGSDMLKDMQELCKVLNIKAEIKWKEQDFT